MKKKIDQLRPHPLQAKMFGDLNDADLKALAANMEAEGLHHAVEITPDNVIITGHQRVRAARLLGWTTIEVVVRRDLAAQGPQAIEHHFMADNLLRRQLTPLARARCIQRLLETGTTGRVREQKKEKIKAEIGKRLSISPRSVNRYLLVLTAPPEIQSAFDAGEISLQLAGRAAMLAESEKRKLLAKIHAGEPAAASVKALLSGRTSDAPSTTTAVRRLLTSFRGLLPSIAAQIAPWQVRQHAEAFRGAARMLAEMLKKAEE